MALSSILGGERAAIHPSGKTTGALGPSDSSDSGSDAMGELGEEQLDSDSDRNGTGERASVDASDDGRSTDILPDHVSRLDGDEGRDLDGAEDLAADDGDAQD
jgi:hypothetical protein